MTAINDFPWGTVLEKWDIGPYTIVKYQQHPRANNKSTSIMYHGFCNGKDLHHGYRSLEAAIAGTIAIAKDGLNTQAGEMFCRMIGVE